MSTDIPRPLRRRFARWSSKTGLGAETIFMRARDAAKGYRNGCGEYSSGYEAGLHHSEVLPGDPTDGSTRAWGDFLIDLGEAL